MTSYVENYDDFSRSLIIPRKTLASRCCDCSFWFFTYLLFGYACADFTLLTYLDHSNKTCSLDNHTFIIDTADGRKILLTSGGVALISLGTMIIFWILPLCDK